ncbi:MAG: FAD-binding protein [Bacillota bacterium]
MGVQFQQTDGKYVRRHPPGHTVPRYLTTVWNGYSYMGRGLSLTEPLLRRVKEQGIQVLDHTRIISLRKKDNRVIGAYGLAVRKSTIINISAKSIVLAAGGAGRIFAQTNNTRDITGDSYRLALEAGASLRDMEFVQFYPTMMYFPVRFALSNPLFGDGAVLRNAHGERFMYRYDPENGDMATSDLMARAIFTEVQEGRGIRGECTSTFLQFPMTVGETGTWSYSSFYTGRVWTRHKAG